MAKKKVKDDAELKQKIDALLEEYGREIFVTYSVNSDNKYFFQVSFREKK